MRATPPHGAPSFHALVPVKRPAMRSVRAPARVSAQADDGAAVTPKTTTITTTAILRMSPAFPDRAVSVRRNIGRRQPCPSGREVAADLVEPSRQEGALDVVVGQRQRLVVRGGGSLPASEQAEEVGPRRAEVAVGGEGRF